jgi:NAD(P)H-nitrite reductase large subunit
MDQKKEKSPPNRMICFCHAVRYQEILLAIQKGAKALHEIQLETMASTGCGGCAYEILDILEEQKEEQKEEQEG